MRRGALWLAGAAICVVALATWLEPRSGAPPGEGVRAVRTGGAGESAVLDDARGRAAARALASQEAVAAPERAAPRPASLRGTRVDGGLVTDADGRFVATPDARRLFDYFLAASGEEPEAVLVARIRAEIARRLPPDAARQANELLDRYLAYRARARALAEQGLGEASAAERLEVLRELRRETLGVEAADAFFAEEEAVDAVTVARQALEEETQLTAEERVQRAAEIEASLPPAERASRRAARAALDLRAAEAELLASGGSPEELRRLRESLVGAEAAERLAALDEQRRAWHERVEDYRAARAALESDPSLDAQARDEAIARLRAERFSGPELLRVEALDAIAGR